jgi:putative NADH-flavin reductase
MKILIFGASGATGQQLVLQALERAHIVTAFVRDPSKLELHHKNVAVFQGNVIDTKNVEDAVKDQDAVLSALGASNPFRKDKALIDGIRNITSAMRNQNVKRFIYQSFLGVRQYRHELGFLIHDVIPLALQSVISDHEAKEEIIQKSNLDWTIVRCGILTNGKFTGLYKDGEHIVGSILPTISRANVADFMLNQLTDQKYVRKSPRIMN